MAEATVEGWMEDMAEALAIGHRIGRRVLLMGCSTGATLATLALHESMGAKVTGVILVSPNYKLADPKSALITWPGARWWVPLLAGREIGFDPRSAAHGQYWTSRYPSLAVLPMGPRCARCIGDGTGTCQSPPFLSSTPATGSSITV
ncbi:hypothetical protein KU6B_17550 [Mameliella alba]|uniref:alpha/beta hydrolase n=1 Tax=Mameliella alba TaxID=561184 RepID=UPI0013E475C4|nr:hypothetical protein [Mameliella alba]BBU55490.1 hypothetical protein KU6B_17550 [Mameliella alba]